MRRVLSKGIYCRLAAHSFLGGPPDAESPMGHYCNRAGRVLEIEKLQSSLDKFQIGAAALFLRT